MISVVILDYYSCNRTIRYIEDFLSYIEINGGISFVVIDNTPDKDNFLKLKGMFEDQFKLHGKSCDYNNEELEEIIVYSSQDLNVTLAFSVGNPGFAKGCNIGAKISRDIYRANRILFSNNDIIFEDVNVIAKLNLSLDENSDVFCTGPNVIGSDGLRQSPHRKIGIWGKWIIPFGCFPLTSMAIRLNSGLVSKFSDIIEKNENGKVYRIIGAFMLVDTDKFFEVGMFDIRTFLYGEEPILAERALKYGYHCYYVHDTKIIHEQNLCVDKEYNVKAKTGLKLNTDINVYYREYLKVPRPVLFLAKIAFELFFFLKPKYCKNK